MNLRESVLRGLYQKVHEDHIAEKGFNSLSLCNQANKFIPMPRSDEILDAKAAVDEEWEKLEKLPAWQMTKVKSKREVTPRSIKTIKELSKMRS